MPRDSCDDHTPPNFGERIARVETARTHLEKSIDEMATNVRDGFAQVKSELGDLRALVELRARTDWKLILSVISASSIILGMAGSLTGYLVLRPIYDAIAESKAKDAACDKIDQQHERWLLEIDTIIRTRRGIFTEPKPPPPP